MRLKVQLQIFSLVLFCGFLFYSPVAAGSAVCLTCHRKIFDTATTRMFVHRPFSQKKCGLCHTPASQTAAPVATTPAEELIRTTAAPGKIEWLAESFTENSVQVALLPFDSCKNDLIIKLWYQNRDKQQAVIRCPVEGDFPVHQRPSQGPVIAQFQRSGYNDKLFTRVTLNWTTSEPCRCKLLYSSDGHDYVDHEDDFYLMSHRQEIRNFNPDNTRVAIRCDNLFQQQTEIPFTPITKVVLQAQPEEESPTRKAGFKADFKRIDDSVEITITTTQPAAVALGREVIANPLSSVSPPDMPAMPTDLPAGTEHPPLARGKQINTSVCFRCHKETVEVASHPINVVAPPGMVIPPEYPLLSDGRMTCMTCHANHSSNNEARLLKEGKKELCIGCHKNY